MGQDELTRGEVKIKNLATGEQRAVPRGAVASALSSNFVPDTTDIGTRKIVLE